MSLLSDTSRSDRLGDRLRDACDCHCRTPGRHHRKCLPALPFRGQSGKTARVEQLIQSGAWTDAALALIDLELPQWQVRRLAYDEGEWHCALSRERELPDWLDQSIEARHADLALAILSAFVEAQRISAPSSRTSVPAVPQDANPLYEPLCSDNFA